MTPVRAQIKRFMGVFIKDRNLLLNMVLSEPFEDDYLYNHSVNMSLISMAIACASGYSQEQIIEIGMGALLADIGMMELPPELRFKSDKLKPNELFEIRKHPLFALAILEKIQGLPESTLLIAFQHHEKPDGIGYPRQRRGKLIHPYARIVSIADSFAAMIHKKGRIGHRSVLIWLWKKNHSNGK